MKETQGLFFNAELMAGRRPSSVAVQQLMSSALWHAAPTRYRGTEFCRAGGVVVRYAAVQPSAGSAFSWALCAGLIMLEIIG